MAELVVSSVVSPLSGPVWQEALQEKLDRYQLDMQNVEIVSDHEKMAALWQNMDADKQKMDALMDEWAELAERLEG